MFVDKLSVTVKELINSAVANNVFPDDITNTQLFPLFRKKDDMIKAIIDL